MQDLPTLCRLKSGPGGCSEASGIPIQEIIATRPDPIVDRLEFGRSYSGIVMPSVCLNGKLKEAMVGDMFAE